MTLLKNIQLGFVVAALALTFVVVSSVLTHMLNFGLVTTALLVVVPCILWPIQGVITQLSDVHPIMGYRRSPYLLLGMVVAFSGIALTPYAALLLTDHMLPGVLLGLVACGTWSLGCNIVFACCVALASDLASVEQRSRTTAIMGIMATLGVIISSFVIGQALVPYSTGHLLVVIRGAALVGLGLTVIGLAGVELRVGSVAKAKRNLATAVSLSADV